MAIIEFVYYLVYCHTSSINRPVLATTIFIRFSGMAIIECIYFFYGFKMKIVEI